MEVIKEKEVIIKKPRRCCMCETKRTPGSAMWAQTNSNEGRIYSLYTCHACKNLLKEFPALFIDFDDLAFPQACVIDYINSNCSFGTTSEDLLDMLRKGNAL